MDRAFVRYFPPLTLGEVAKPTAQSTPSLLQDCRQIAPHGVAHPLPNSSLFTDPFRLLPGFLRRNVSTIKHSANSHPGRMNLRWEFSGLCDPKWGMGR